MDEKRADMDEDVDIDIDVENKAINNVMSNLPEVSKLQVSLYNCQEEYVRCMQDISELNLLDNFDYKANYYMICMKNDFEVGHIYHSGCVCYNLQNALRKYGLNGYIIVEIEVDECDVYHDNEAFCVRSFCVSKIMRLRDLITNMDYYHKVKQIFTKDDIEMIVGFYISSEVERKLYANPKLFRVMDRPNSHIRELAVNLCWENIKYMPPSLLTKELAISAIKQSYDALRHLEHYREDLFTEIEEKHFDIIENAVCEYMKREGCLDEIPKEWRTTKVIVESIKTGNYFHVYRLEFKIIKDEVKINEEIALALMENTHEHHRVEIAAVIPKELFELESMEKWRKYAPDSSCVVM